MEKLYLLAKGLNARFPKGVEPYQIMTCLAEECGEVAQQVNHWEDSGIKRLKYGEPSKDALAGELKNVLSTVFRLVLYYHVEEELEKSIDNSLDG